MPARMKDVIVRLPPEKFEELRRRGLEAERDAWQQARYILLRYLEDRLTESDAERQTA